MRKAFWLLALVSCSAARNRPGSATLWEIVHERCVPNQVAGKGPGPCSAVERDDVLLKDLRGATHFLLIPTARITGIEDPALLLQGSPNYWQDAWKARGAVGERAHRTLTRDQIGMGINGPRARTQDQLHIHVDCLAPGVQEELAASRVGADFSRVEIRGFSYRVRRIDQEDLAGLDPFKLLASRLSGPGDTMSNHALTVLGASFQGGMPGFYLLDNASSGEALLDRSCAIAGR